MYKHLFLRDLPIECLLSLFYKYLLYLDNTTSTKISFWDSSKTFISRSSDYTVLGTDVEIEFPEGTAYFRVKTDAVDPVTIDNVNEHVIVKKVSI